MFYTNNQMLNTEEMVEERSDGGVFVFHMYSNPWLAFTWEVSLGNTCREKVGRGSVGELGEGEMAGELRESWQRR